MKSKIINCKTCGAEISKDAKICPKCGARNKKKFPRFLGIILIVLGCIGIIGALSDSGDKKGNIDSEVTLEEFMQIKSGMTYDEVVDIIGFDGELTSQVDYGSFDFGEETIDTSTDFYIWKNLLGSNCIVVFQGGVVTTKSQFGLD